MGIHLLLSFRHQSDPMKPKAGDPGTERRECNQCREEKNWVEFETYKTKGKWLTRLICIECRRNQYYERVQSYKDARVGQEVITSKVCAKCLLDREIRYFDEDAAKVDGYGIYCVECEFLPGLIDRAKTRNKDRNEKNRHMPPVEIDVNFLRARTTCCYSGLPVRFHPGVNDMASLDRKNNEDGYTFSNSQICNIRFNVGGADEKQWNHVKYAEAFKPGWKDFIERRVEDLRTKPKNPHLGYGQNMYFTSISTNCNSRNTYKCAQFKEKGKEVPNNIVTIQPEDIREMWISQDGLCAYSGIPMDWTKKKAWGMSIEKINGGFYTLDNMLLVCQEFNSTEYQTTRFQDLCTGPQGWNKEIVDFYRDLESKRQNLIDILSRWFSRTKSGTAALEKD
jgi:hypothetical protein